MQYKTVFDNVNAGYTTWHFAVPGMVGLVIGAVLVALVVKRGTLPFPRWSTRPKRSKIFAFFIFGFSLLWLVAALHSTYHQYATLAAARSNGTAAVVEGTVSDFKPMPVSGHAMEH